MYISVKRAEKGSTVGQYEFNSLGGCILKELGKPFEAVLGGMAIPAAILKNTQSILSGLCIDI